MMISMQICSISLYFFDKISSGGAVTKSNKSIQNKKQKKPISKRITQANFWEIQKSENTLIFYRQYLGCWSSKLISKYKKGIRLLLWAIDIYSKYAWVTRLKDEKGITVTNAFQKILGESNRNPNKILTDKSSEFYNRLTKS